MPRLANRRPTTDGRKPRGYRPALLTLEDRVPPGETVLGAPVKAVARPSATTARCRSWSNSFSSIG